MYIADYGRPPRRSRLWAWAVDDRCRFARMLFLLIAVSFFAVLTFGAALPQWNWSWGSQKALRFTRSGTFQIAIFEDLHFGESR